MNNLEIRMLNTNVVINMEMDECLEVIFVEKGLYKVGYQINNQQFFKRRFGMFTSIGGFQACYDKRYDFIYKTITDLKGIAIRKTSLKLILEDFPDFKIQMKNKFWTHYSQEVYQPLKKCKNIDMLDFNYREDFK